MPLAGRGCRNKGLHVLDFQAAVIQRAERGERAEHVDVGAGAGLLEFRHVDAITYTSVIYLPPHAARG
jgi:hypothetical protein